MTTPHDRKRPTTRVHEAHTRAVLDVADTLTASGKPDAAAGLALLPAALLRPTELVAPGNHVRQGCLHVPVTACEGVVVPGRSVPLSRAARVILGCRDGALLDLLAVDTREAPAFLAQLRHDLDERYGAHPEQTWSELIRSAAAASGDWQAVAAYAGLATGHASHVGRRRLEAVADLLDTAITAAGRLIPDAEPHAA